MYNETTKHLVEQVKRHEGYRKDLYKCTAGKLTIGYGFNVEAGISKEVAGKLLEAQLEEIWWQCNKEFSSFWSTLSPKRQNVLVNMVFNLGLGGVKKFKKFIQALEEKDYGRASLEMLDSKWAKQVGDRATELSIQMKNGETRNPLIPPCVGHALEAP